MLTKGPIPIAPTADPAEHKLVRIEDHDSKRMIQK